MKKLVLLAGMFLATTIGVSAQSKYFTKTGNVKFFSSTPVENIEAVNHKSVSIVDLSTGDMEFSLLNMAFEFEKALMQEHFNENYMESPKYPKSTFKGKIDKVSSIDVTKDGVYPVTVSGKLTMHGETRDVTTKGNFTVRNGKLSGTSVFKVSPEDYKIVIPGLVKDKIAKEIEVTVNCSYELYKK